MCVCVFSRFCFDCFPGEFAGCVTLSGDRFQPIFFLERYLGDGGMVDTCFLLAGDRADLKTIVNLVTNIG